LSEETSGVWKYVATTALGILGGLIMALLVGTGPQRQLDAQSVQIAHLEVEVVKLQVDVARLSEHFGLKENNK
jgi:hypothetical protein